MMAPEDEDFFMEKLADTGAEVVRSLDEARKERSLQVSMVLIKNNIPFRVVSCKLFRAIFTDGAGKCSLPSREYLSLLS